MNVKYILRPAFTLFIIAAVTIAALGVAHTLTLEPIETKKRGVREAAMREVLPLAADYREIPLPESLRDRGSIAAVYRGESGGELCGYVVQCAPEGYGGVIDILVGISAPGASSGEKITGMRVLRHSETPGLGALAVKEDFYRRFDGKPLVPLGVARNSPGENDIQAITSATITSRAITGAVNEAIEWYRSGVK